MQVYENSPKTNEDLLSLLQGEQNLDSGFLEDQRKFYQSLKTGIDDACLTGRQLDFDAIRKLCTLDFLAEHFISYIKSRSRKDAATNRGEVLQRSNGYCEICSSFCLPIINVHHVVPVNNGGTGVSGNLIALCPNCHSCVHRIREKINSKDREGFRVFYSWLNHSNNFDALCSIATSQAYFENNYWHFYGMLSAGWQDE